MSVGRAFVVNGFARAGQSPGDTVAFRGRTRCTHVSGPASCVAGIALRRCLRAGRVARLARFFRSPAVGSSLWPVFRSLFLNVCGHKPLVLRSGGSGRSRACPVTWRPALALHLACGLASLPRSGARPFGSHRVGRSWSWCFRHCLSLCRCATLCARACATRRVSLLCPPHWVVVRAALPGAYAIAIVLCRLAYPPRLCTRARGALSWRRANDVDLVRACGPACATPLWRLPKRRSPVLRGLFCRGCWCVGMLRFMLRCRRVPTPRC